MTIYNDGLLCLKCSIYVCRHLKGIKRHWSEEHQWSPGSHRGRPKPSKIADIQAQIDTNSTHVSCQRVFKNGAGSHFIHVHQTITQPEPAPPADTIQQLVQRVRELQAQQTRSQGTNIQAGEFDEATSWLNRTGWLDYLKGIPADLLVRSMERPTEDSEGPEGAAYAIWQAMERLAIVSQQVTRASGFLVRIEAARTQKAESPYKPLLAYMNEAEIIDHIEPWQRILMFFTRTQQPHEWQSPKYQFTSRQQRSWEIV